jgi:hemolysin activation/secretion protein
LEGGRMTLRNPLPEQVSRDDLASYGFGSRIKVQDHLNGSIDVAIPLIGQVDTSVHDVRVLFRLWADF